ncbi:MAG: copper resistance protein NlpE [Treponema sp.]|jgi:uncharacterized lipoprotein NlpE involved in copper resistance|nr:copper resistance protein NlpE [Treponema sp.]
MNRKTFIIFLLAAAVAIFGLSSCLSNKGTDIHNSRISLDWDGVYTGTIPSASGTGINVRLRLNRDQSFELNYIYIDRLDGQFKRTGTFNWDEAGNVIKLDINNDDVSPYYKPIEGKLIQLDMKGKPIKGKLADNYVLNKEQ